MELDIDGVLERPDPLRLCLRPVAIWLGLATFLAGAIFLGGTLAGDAEPFIGPVLLLLGVALVGGAFTMDATELSLDPDLEFTGQRWSLVATASALCLLLAVAVVALSVV